MRTMVSLGHIDNDSRGRGGTTCAVFAGSSVVMDVKFHVIDDVPRVVVVHMLRRIYKYFTGHSLLVVTVSSSLCPAITFCEEAPENSVDSTS